MGADGLTAPVLSTSVMDDTGWNLLLNMCSTSSLLKLEMGKSCHTGTEVLSNATTTESYRTSTDATKLLSTSRRLTCLPFFLLHVTFRPVDLRHGFHLDLGHRCGAFLHLVVVPCAILEN